MLLTNSSDWGVKQSGTPLLRNPKRYIQFRKMLRCNLDAEREAIVFNKNLCVNTQHADAVTADFVVKIIGEGVEDEDKLLQLLSN